MNYQKCQSYQSNEHFMHNLSNLIKNFKKKVTKKPNEISQLCLIYSFSWYFLTILLIVLSRGGSRIFSRGAGFQKISKILTTLFFRTTKLIYRALPKYYKDSIMTKNSAPQAKCEKKRTKKEFLDTFWKNFDQKNRVILARAPPLKL